jgi:hypothetical protein
LKVIGGAGIFRIVSKDFSYSWSQTVISEVEGVGLSALIYLLPLSFSVCVLEETNNPAWYVRENVPTNGNVCLTKTCI